MREQLYHVLFLCTHNSARSVIAECILNRLGQGRFKAYRAGSQPSGQFHPMALTLLKKVNYDTSGLRSKSWKTSCSRSVMTRLKRFARCGRVSP